MVDLEGEELEKFEEYMEELTESNIRRGEARAIALNRMGYDRSEIGRILGIKSNTVKNHLRKGKHRLKMNQVISSEDRKKYMRGL